jgi:hypothetical protein
MGGKNIGNNVKMSNYGFIGGQKDNTKTPCSLKSSTLRVTTLPEVSREQTLRLRLGSRKPKLHVVQKSVVSGFLDP